MSSEREETLVEQLKLREERILVLEEKLRECIEVMEELAKGTEHMLQLWDKQQARMVILEAAVRGPMFPDTK